MVYRTDRRSSAGGGCHCVISAFYAAWRSGKSVWHRGREPDLPAAWKGRGWKCRENRHLCPMGIRHGHAVLFFTYIRSGNTGADCTGHWRRDTCIRGAVFVLDGRGRRNPDGAQSGPCQYCPGAGAGEDSQHRNVGGRNPQCGARSAVYIRAAYECGGGGACDLYLQCGFRAVSFGAYHPHPERKHRTACSVSTEAQAFLCGGGVLGGGSRGIADRPGVCIQQRDDTAHVRLCGKRHFRAWDCTED